MRSNLVHRLVIATLLIAVVGCVSETDTEQVETEPNDTEHEDDRFNRVEMPSAEVFRIENIPEGDMDGEIRFRDVKGVTTLISHVELDMGAKSPAHNHPEEQMNLVLRGLLRVYSDGKTWVLNPGDVVRFPPYVPHQVEALVDTEIIEVFGPGNVIYPMVPAVEADTVGD